jgi:hypothetical protein
MELRTYEGTWEEIARHAAEFAGHRVRLTVLDGPGSPSMLDSTLGGLIEEAERLAASRRPDSDSAPAGAGTWGDAVAEKFRRQGFSL